MSGEYGNAPLRPYKPVQGSAAYKTSMLFRKHTPIVNNGVTGYTQKFNRQRRLLSTSWK